MEEVKSKHTKDCWLYQGCPTAAVAACQKPKGHYYFEYQFTYILKGNNKCLCLQLHQQFNTNCFCELLKPEHQPLIWNLLEEGVWGSHIYKDL